MFNLCGLVKKIPVQPFDRIPYSHKKWRGIFDILGFFCLFVFRRQVLSVTQAGFKLLGSSDPPFLAFQVTGTAGMYHCADYWHLLAHIDPYNIYWMGK
jgi:hypothetical protein